MKLSLSWIRDYVDLPADTDLKKLAYDLTMDTVEVEDVALSIEGVRDCICIAADHPIMGKAVKLLVVMKDGACFDKRHIARYIAARLEPYKVPMLYEQVETVARTYNGKLDRKFYK